MDEKQQVIVPVSDQEASLAFEVPAPITNKFFVHASPAGVRITFAEMNPGSNQPSIRAAVFLHPQDAFQFRDVLAGVIQPLEDQIKAAIAKEDQKDG